MNANDFPLGTLFENKETGHIIEVIEGDYNGEMFFEDVEYGDLYTWVDEDIYNEIYKGTDRL